MRKLFGLPLTLVALAMLAGCSTIADLIGSATSSTEAARSTEVTTAPPAATRSSAPTARGPAAAATDRAPAAAVTLAPQAAGAPALPGAVSGEPRMASVSTPGTADPSAQARAMARIVYFDFDSFAIRSDARPLLETQARALTGDRTRRIVVEGHADARGGREYNLALGQRRADAVVQALVALGVSDAQLESVSFGMEKPAAAGPGEDSWLRNRRVELKDRR